MKKYILFLTAMAAVACASDKLYDASGSFEATEITVSAEGNGKILSLDIEEGVTVEAGTVIGVIDTVQLYLQKLQLQKQGASVRSSRPDTDRQVAALRSQITQAEREKSRIEGLLQDGAATQKSLDDVTAQIAVLKAQLDAALSSLRSSASAVDANSSAIDLQIAQVEDMLSKCQISSPVSGTILAQYLREGEMAVTGKPIFKVADLSKIYLRAYFTSDQLSDIQLGQKVKVVADYGGDNQVEYPGTITWIASESEFTPKTIQTKDSRAHLVYAVKIAVRGDGRLKIGLAGNVIL
ncbi:MAG: HlyD family efflux transporter periplasmic adaptor subunit [Bacteroidales bacterium]|nr:HlyD family efflux transporter periplasmic adaptor subunit [Bacteroidales bacterium]MBO6063547.1 HlyD family efflux transporter periplasmic adaptor subunit [Bacteroidales bacterium]